MDSPKIPLYRAHELAFRTQYAELKERARSTMPLLPGTPGTLVKRAGTGRAYWYRVYQTAAGTQVEDLVCKDGEEQVLQGARAELDFAQWTAAQARNLRKLEFQVADKGVASDLLQAVTLAAVLTEQEDEILADSFGDVPAAMRVVVRKRLPSVCRALSAHTRTREAFEQALA